MNCYSGRLMSSILSRGGNNFDLLRLIAAFAVIVGHAYAIAPQPPLQDAVLTLLHFDYSGSLAVKFFFFLSGLLVTDSILRQPEPLLFLVRRLLRIFPGLLICLLVSAFIIGPVFTGFPIHEYIKNAETWSYVSRNLFLVDLQWRLPGVFNESKYGLNGSLWTLRYEFICYVFIAVFCGVGMFSYRILTNFIFISIVALSFLAPKYIPIFAQQPEAFLLPACFLLGALFAVNKQRIKINLVNVILLWMLVLIVNEPRAHLFIFYIAFFYTMVYIASINFIVSYFKIPFDASYGVYVYGFVIQQCVFFVLPNIGLHGNQIMSIFIALMIGVVSWYFVEKPAILFGSRITKNRNNSIDTYFNKVKHQFLSLFFEKNISIIGFMKVKKLAIFELCILIAISLIIHALVLNYIFPGYYSPLFPHHSDHYIPAELANLNDSILSYIKWPRPVGMFFLVIIGFFGIKGSIAVIIGLTFLNCVLTAMLFRRILSIDLNLIFILSFSIYEFLLFSHPYFYIFYSQDSFAQLSYFFLIIGTWCFYILRKREFELSLVLLFFISLLAFLAKETYGLTSLIVTGVWYLYSRKHLLPPHHAIYPMLVIGGSLLLAIGYSVFINSEFVALNGTLPGSPYRVDFTPISIIKEWGKYAVEGLNILNIGVLVIIIIACARLFKNSGKNALYIFVGCVSSGLFSWLPNSLLPEHHYSGYSWSGAYLLYLPVLLLPLIFAKTWIGRLISIVIISISLISPVLNKSKYNNNMWFLIQENSQRNLLHSLDDLIGALENSNESKKILITGLSFPFSPFAHPMSLRTFPGVRNISFDVVNYSSFKHNEQVKWVRYLRPSDVNLSIYSDVWMFASDGHLAYSLNNVNSEFKLIFGFDRKDFILFPDVASALGVFKYVGDNYSFLPPNSEQFMKCGVAFSLYQQHELALRCFNESINIAPDNPYGYYFSGIELERLSRLKEAKLFFELAVKNDNPNNSNPEFIKALKNVDQLAK